MTPKSEKEQKKVLVDTIQDEDNYYTTNEVIIRILNLRKYIKKVLTVFMWLGVPTFFIGLILMFVGGGIVDEGLCTSFVPAVFFTGLSIFLFGILSLAFGAIFGSFEDWLHAALTHFIWTDEFDIQAKEYMKAAKEAIEKNKLEKATKLIESYDILDDKDKSKEERIELIKDYIDWKN